MGCRACGTERTRTLGVRTRPVASYASQGVLIPLKTQNAIAIGGVLEFHRIVKTFRDHE